MHPLSRKTRPVAALAIVVIAVALMSLTLLLPRRADAQQGYSLRFYGTGARDVDRVKIPLDAPHRPVDVGATDFTIEFWMRALPGDNASGPCVAGQDTWINGNVMFDRDIFGTGDYGDYGISLYGGRIAFGVATSSASQTICGATNVADGQWHHIAVTRRFSNGELTVFVDGALDARATGPVGDISYRDGRTAQWPNEPYLVIGAEKHDYDRTAYPSFNGWIDEVHISQMLRYTAPFSRPTQPFVPDALTVALYHFDEGAGVVVNDTSGAAGEPANGTLFVDPLSGNPVWSTETPPWTGSTPPTNTPLPPTTTSTPLPPTATSTPLPPTATSTPLPPTATSTPLPPTATSTPLPPTATSTPLPPTATPLPSGGTLRFDGVNDEVRGGQIAGLGSAQTIELWVRPATNEQNSIIIVHGDDNTGWSLELNSGRVTWWAASTAGWRSAQHPTALAANTWHHVAVTYDGATARVFVNGAMGAAATIGAITQGPFLRIGGLAGYGFFNGDLDDVRISNVVRYTSTFTPPSTVHPADASTRALYRLDEGSGQTIADASGNGYTLTLGITSGADSADPLWVASTAPIEMPSPTATPMPTGLPTATSTPLPPTATSTPLPPTATSTPLPPTNTSTPLPPTATPTPIGEGPAQNLLQNGGFELDANGDTRPDNWTTNTRVTRSAAVVRSGSYAMRHYATDNANYTISQTVAGVAAGTNYVLLGYVTIPPTSDAFTFNVRVRWLRSDNTIIRTDTARSFTGSTGGVWEMARGVYTAPSGAVQARIEMNVSSLNATVYADDFAFGTASGSGTTPTASPAPPTAPPTATPTQSPIAGTNGALAFDGIDDEASNAAFSMSGGFTVEAWVRPASSNQTSIVIVTGDGSRGWSLELNNGRATLWVANSAGAWSFVRNDGVVLQANQWYHVAATYDSGNVRVFVNGVAGPSGAVGTVSHMPVLRLGGLNGYGFFAGQLDDVRVSRIVRYTGDFIPPSAPLTADADAIALYVFDEGSGQTAYDASASGYHLTHGRNSGVDSADPQRVTSTAPGR